MGAISRVKRDHNNNMMIPQNVSGSSYEEGASVKQAVAACLLLLGTIVVIFWFKDTYAAQKIINWVLVIGLLVFIIQFVVRYVIIDERYLMKQTNLLLNAQDKVPADLWGVINIDNDGIIYYQDGRLGVVIEAEQATVVGRDNQFKETHYSSLSDFYKVLNQNGISWAHYNAMISAKSENRLNNVAEELNKCENSAIKKMCDMHLAYLRNLEIRTLYEKEYWALIARPSMGKDKLLEVVYQAGDYLESAAFNQYTILKKEQCYEFNTETQALNSFDANAIMIEKAQRVAGAPIAKLVQVKVKTGHITERQATLISAALKPYGDNSRYVDTVKHISTFEIGPKLGNTITQRLQYLIRDKRQLNAGELLSNCMNIKLVESSNSATKNKKPEPKQETPETFDISTEVPPAFEYFTDAAETDIDAQLKAVQDMNQQIFQNDTQFKREEAQRQASERRTAEQARIAAQQEANRVTREQEEKARKARVNFDEFD